MNINMLPTILTNTRWRWKYQVLHTFLYRNA